MVSGGKPAARRSELTWPTIRRDDLDGDPLVARCARFVPGWKAIIGLSAFWAEATTIPLREIQAESASSGGTRPAGRSSQLDQRVTNAPTIGSKKGSLLPWTCRRERNLPSLDTVRPSSSETPPPK